MMVQIQDSQYSDKNTVSRVNQQPSMFNESFFQLNQRSMDTLFLAKKVHKQRQDELNTILNRMELLRREEEQRLKKIEDTKIKTFRIVQTKENNFNKNDNKLKQKNEEEINLKIRQSQNYEMRKQQEIERQMIMDALVSIKRQERDNIKKLSEQNDNFIKNQKNNQTQLNQFRTTKVKLSEEETRNKIQMFWTDKLNSIHEKGEQERIHHIQQINMNENILLKLGEQEMNMIARLQRSQDLQQSLNSRLENAILLPASDFKRIYGMNNSELSKESESQQKKVSLSNPQSTSNGGRKLLDPQDFTSLASPNKYSSFSPIEIYSLDQKKKSSKFRNFQIDEQSQKSYSYSKKTPTPIE